MIVVIDYNMGNVGSIANMIKKVGGDVLITSDKNEIAKAHKLILPGVGAFDAGMENIQQMGLLDVLQEKVIVQKTPILGICLGMQLLGHRSEEGSLPGLAWIDAETIRFPRGGEDCQGLKVPHMGWNRVDVKKSGPLFKDMFEAPRFYFVHSYFVRCRNFEDVLCETRYGISFASAVQHENVWGTQFHPEKSHKFGMKLLSNFVYHV